MRTTKGLLAVAATALALMGFASSAVAATDGVVRDVTPPNVIIPENRELHAVGWAKFAGGVGSVTCHVTSVIKAIGATGTTGNVTNFSVPDVTKCTFPFPLNGCTLSSSTTDNLPYHVTVTPPGAGIPAGDLDVLPGISGNLLLTQTFAGAFCPIKGNNKIEATAITLTPLKTGTNVVTNTSNLLGGTAALNNPIAGVELSGNATLTKPDGSKENVAVTGELELTSPDRCTWFIAAT